MKTVYDNAAGNVYLLKILVLKKKNRLLTGYSQLEVAFAFSILKHLYFIVAHITPGPLVRRGGREQGSRLVGASNGAHIGSNLKDTRNSASTEITL